MDPDPMLEVQFISDKNAHIGIGERLLLRAAQTFCLALLAPALLSGQQRNIPSYSSQMETGRMEHEAVYKCETKGVQLKGRLTERTFYGPPGFGETPTRDIREKALILRLAEPITAEPADNAEARDSTCLEVYRNVREVQLWSHSLALNARKLLGKIVVAVGTLDEDPAPSMHTNVTMEVDSIRPR